MQKLRIPKPVSAGILLSYQCTSRCKHCMYACSPQWPGDWYTEDQLRTILRELADGLKDSPMNSHSVNLNLGLHFTGGEPFLNYNLLLRAVELAKELEIPSTFVETNGYWCHNEVTTQQKFANLKKAGLDGILISVNPFILEQIPFQRTELAIKIGRSLFGQNLMIYQTYFYHHFRQQGILNTIPLHDYLVHHSPSLANIELIPMGRAPYTLSHLYQKYPASAFFGESCLREFTRKWHVHIDNYCNYIPGYCGGISLGDARDLDSLCTQGIDLTAHPLIEALVSDLRDLYDIGVKHYNYEDLKGGYVSKCHMCVDLRRHIIHHTDEYSELQPAAFYAFL